MTQTPPYIPDERTLNNIIIGHERQCLLLNKKTRAYKSYLTYKMARILTDFLNTETRVINPTNAHVHEYFLRVHLLVLLHEFKYSFDARTWNTLRLEVS